LQGKKRAFARFLGLDGAKRHKLLGFLIDRASGQPCPLKNPRPTSKARIAVSNCSAPATNLRIAANRIASAERTRRGLLVLGLLLLFLEAARAQNREFDALFPGLAEYREGVFSPGGVIRTVEKPEDLRLKPSALSGIETVPPPLRGPNACFVESLMVIPRERGLELLDIYNALGNIRDLKGRVYHSHTRQKYIPLFEEATRIESPRKTSAIPDPSPRPLLPERESIYIRLKDVNFGNSYYQADISGGPGGIYYRLFNIRGLSYLLFTVIKEEKFTADLYLEPVAEGVLIYGLAATEAGDFIASKIDIPSAISKRLEVILNWAADNIRAMP
jgi:hypothetical protein